MDEIFELVLTIWKKERKAGGNNRSTSSEPVNAVYVSMQIKAVVESSTSERIFGTQGA